MDVEAVKSLLDKTSVAIAAVEAGNNDKFQDALSNLHKLKELEVSTQLLLNTGAGKTVKKFSKSGKAEVAKAATAVVEAWKEAVKREQSAGGSKPGSSGVKRDRDGDSVGMPAKRQDSVGLGLSSSGGSMDFKQKVEARPAAPPKPLNIPKTGNPERDRMRELLAQPLLLALPDVPDGDPGGIAAEIEEGMFKQAGGVNPKYKAKYRSLNFNLKDATNPDLRRKVLSGEIAGPELPFLAPEELASDAKRQQNSEIRKKATFEANPAAGLKMSTTDAFQCGKCKQRKCVYYQMQTRSADEPMTTFVTCVNCNNRWKFS